MSQKLSKVRIQTSFQKEVKKKKHIKFYNTRGTNLKYQHKIVMDHRNFNNNWSKFSNTVDNRNSQTKMLKFDIARKITNWQPKLIRL